MLKTTPEYHQLGYKKPLEWRLKKLDESSQSLTNGGPLLTVSSRTLSIKDAHRFVKAAVELCSIGWEAQGVGRRQLIQVVVGSETCPHLPVKRIPHVHWIITATAG